MLREGETFPQGITLPDQDGQNVHLDDLIGQGPVVLYFYPADDTPGCTRQACTFRDQYEDFEELGATVIGVSSDSPGKHQRFRERHDLPFTLLSDPSGVLRQRLGVPKTLGIVGRVTFVIDVEGTVVKVFKSQIQAMRHVREALEALRGITAQAQS